MKQITTETPSISQSLAASSALNVEAASQAVEPPSTQRNADALPTGEAAGPLILRPPAIGDAPAIHGLIQRSPPLDLNSLYAYLLLCRDFAQTCVVAASEHDIEGFVSAYVPPQRPDTLFVWQVAVDSRRRGQGLGSRLLQSLLQRPELAGVRFIEATVGPGNQASRAMFAAWAKALGIPLNESPLFDAELFGEGHESECLLRLGPRHVQPVWAENTAGSVTAGQAPAAATPKTARPFCDQEP